MQFAFGQRTKLARRELVQRQRAHLHARQIAHLVPDLREHASHLTVAPFADRNLQRARVIVALENRDVAPPRFEAFPLAWIRQPDPSLQIIERFTAHVTIHNRPIRLRDAIAGVRELVRQLAVVRQQQQPLRFRIQPPHRIHPRKVWRKQINRPRLLALRDVRAEHVLGLVHHNINAWPTVLPLELQRLVIHRHPIARRVDQNRQLRHDLSVYRDATLANHVLDIAARRDPGVGEDFLDSFFHSWIITGST